MAAAPNAVLLLDVVLEYNELAPMAVPWDPVMFLSNA
jgi:hypothetical protein